MNDALGHCGTDRRKKCISGPLSNETVKADQQKIPAEQKALTADR